MSEGGREEAAQLQLGLHQVRKRSALLETLRMVSACLDGFLGMCGGQPVFLLLRALNLVVLC